MHNDKFTDLDLELRSMFLDAEEEVPSRVWDSLSAELDRRERRKVVALRWRRAAAGVAAAAAVLSGVFMLSKNHAELLQPVSPQLVADVQETAVPESPKIAELSIEDQIAASSQLFLADVPQTSKPAVSPAEPEVSAVKPSETVPAEVFYSVTEPSEPVNVVSAPAPTSAPAAATEREEEWVDPFAGLENEEEKPERSVSLTLAGNVMSNDATSGGTRAMHASPFGNSQVQKGITEKSISTYGIPLSFGIGARITLNDKWSLGTGIDWTLLTRSFSGIYSEGLNGENIPTSISSDITHELHYIGIPLNLYYNILNNNDIDFYVWGGTGLEKGISNKYRIHSKPEDIFYKESISGVQWSAAIGLGLQFSLNDWLGLYIDPSARYYFDCDQPASVRTQKPFMLNFEAGLRFNL